MARVVALRRDMPPSMPAGPVQAAPRRIEAAELAMVARKKLLVDYVLLKKAEGLKHERAADWVADHLAAGLLPAPYVDASRALAKKGAQHVSGSSLSRWAKAFEKRGAKAMAREYEGRKRQAQPWDHLAIELLQLPSHPSCGEVAFWLRERHGFPAATAAQVRSLWKNLPSNLAETSPKRLGADHYRLTHKPHQILDQLSIKPGDVWEIDGHRCDVFVAHPVTGAHYRPEMTLIIDKGSGYIVHWQLHDNESGIDSLFAISAAIRKHKHLPLLIHADRGSLKSKMLRDQVTGFLGNLGIGLQLAHPRNPHGKGLIERNFGILEARLGKLLPTYCGHCRTDDELQRLEYKIRKGAIELPTQQQYQSELDWYHAAHARQIDQNRGGQLSRLQLWAQRTLRPIAHPEDAIARPAAQATVSHWRIRHQNRWYQAAELQAYEKRPVVFEYEMHDDSQIWVYDLQRRFIATAQLVKKLDGMPDSRRQEQEEKSLREKRRRLRNREAELAARSRGAITAEHSLQALDDFSTPALPAEPQNEEGADELPLIDPLDLSYSDE